MTFCALWHTGTHTTCTPPLSACASPQGLCGTVQVMLYLGALVMLGVVPLRACLELLWKHEQATLPAEGGPMLGCPMQRSLLWHLRLGCCFPQELQQMQRSGGVPELDPGACFLDDASNLAASLGLLPKVRPAQPPSEGV